MKYIYETLNFQLVLDEDGAEFEELRKYPSHWPYLKKKTYFLAHADTVLGRKCKNCEIKTLN